MLNDLANSTVIGIIAFIGQVNSSLFLVQIHQKFACPMHATMPNTVSLMGFYWNHKPIAGGRSLGEDTEKVELAQFFEKCDELSDTKTATNSPLNLNFFLRTSRISTVFTCKWHYLCLNMLT